MNRSISLFVVAALLVVGSALAGDLYIIDVHSRMDAARLHSTGVTAVARLNTGFLVLVEREQSNLLSESGLSYRLVASNVHSENLAFDNRLDRSNVQKYPLLYEEGNLRVFALPNSAKSAALSEMELRPLSDDPIAFSFAEPTMTAGEIISSFQQQDIGLDTLILRISQDSLQSYLLQLQGYPYRRAGSVANTNSRMWIESKLQSFGYDSVMLDPFTPTIGGVPTSCHNVLAYKVGTLYPNHFVIIGAHRDAVVASPGADDNGSGTVAVLEIARALFDIPTDMTIIFALFDAEEDGLLGSNHYVQEAYARGDSIVYMLNMDMIAHFQNTTAANVFHGPITTNSNVWIHLADSLVGITGVLAGASGGSDHYPFTQKGYDASFVAESIFSTVYHTFRDSVTYLSFPYMTKLVKASLACAYVVNATSGPTPALALSYPDGVPQTIAPQTPTTLHIAISSGYGGTISPGTEKFCYSLNGGNFVETAMTELTPGQYQATMPTLNCGDRVRYFARVDEVTNGTFYSPDSAHAGEIVGATSSIAVFTENFELDNGWVATGNAVDGQWSRGVPVGLGDRGDPATDFDSSGQCFLTDNVYGNSDVDGGTVWLASPVIDLSAGDARIHYARWFSNNFGAAPNEDVFRVYVSNDAGASWTIVETVGPVAESGGEWYEHSFWVSDFVTPSSQIALRFEANDLGSGSVIEAAIDDVTVTRFECIPPSCCINIRGNANGDVSDLVNVVDLTFLVQYLFGGGAEPVCIEEGDANSSGSINVVDLTYLVQFLFQGGPGPSACS